MGTVHAKEIERSDVLPPKEEITLDKIKATVDKIHIDGLLHTKDDIAIHAIKDVFSAKDFQQVILKAHEARLHLESLGIFKNVSIFIDTSSGESAKPDGLEVTFLVKEQKRVVGGINTLVGNNEGSLVFGVRIPNSFGRAERIQGEYAYGTKNSSGFNITFSKPFWNINIPKASLTTAIFQQAGEIPWSGFREVDRGLLADISFESAPKVRHNLRWEGVWRELNVLPSGTAFAVREEMGHSLKSSIKHTLTMDHRDSGIMPTTGLLFRIAQEFAGIGGDVGFLKHELGMETNFNLPFDCVLQGGFIGGFLHQKSDKTYGIADRLFLGGPLTLRGFENRGAGPHSERLALGADAYWASALHLYTPLPFRPGKGGIGEYFRTHFFINAGNIGNFQFGDDYQQLSTSLLENLRWAYGAGVVIRLGQVARLEINYCLPVSVQRGDRACHGLQVGVGISYL